MKRWFFLILPFILAACGPASVRPAAVGTAVNGQGYTQAPGLSATRLAMLTAQAETVTAGYVENDATLTAIMTSKSGLATTMAATMTA